MYNKIQRCMLGCVEVNLLHFVLISSGAICNMCNVPYTQNLSYCVTAPLLFPLLHALLSLPACTWCEFECFDSYHHTSTLAITAPYSTLTRWLCFAMVIQLLTSHCGGGDEISPDKYFYCLYKQKGCTKYWGEGGEGGDGIECLI